MTLPTAEVRRRAVLVGIWVNGEAEADQRASLAELQRLTETLGVDVVATLTQRRRSIDAAVLGEGKLVELAALTGGPGVIVRGPASHRKKVLDALEDEDEDDDPSDEVTPDDFAPEPAPRGRAAPIADLVVVDAELSPMQLRNLASASGCEVTDRTGVIVDIFHRHASTREARLQVEIARLTYVAPRMRASGGGERQRGGIGQKGAGESQLELDRRKIRDRIAELRQELAEIEGERGVRRRRRSESLRVALVGYTNAGKSSWMRRLTGSQVLVADQLFATLDTTVRALHPETTPRILVSDTVGFIQRLPHDLVASFRSTLEEAAEAALLVHVVDAADPAFRQQLAVTQGVLAEIEADGVPTLLLLNKIDRVPEAERAALAAEFPGALQVSAHDDADLVRVHDAIVASFESVMGEAVVHVPYSRGKLTGELRRKLRVLSEEFDDDGAIFHVRGSRAEIDRLIALVGDRPDPA